MKWIYYFEDKWAKKGQEQMCKIYFRPVMKDAEGNMMAGNMTILHVYALDFVMNRKEQLSEEERKHLFEIYFNHLKDKDYYFDVDRKPKGHEDYLHCGGTLYLKVEGFNPTDLIEWIKVFLQIEGYPVDSLEKAPYNEFADENPMMRMLTNAAREGEKTLGKEWWNKKDEEKKESKSPKNPKNTEGGKKKK
jgi:hypothetical protein